jgi:hypothetical protein
MFIKTNYYTKKIYVIDICFFLIKRHFPAFLTIFQIDYINIFNTITIAGIHRILLLTENTSNSLAGKWHGAKLSLKMSFET